MNNIMNMINKDCMTQPIKTGQHKAYKTISLIMLILLIGSLSIFSSPSYATDPAVAEKTDIAISNYPLFLISEAVTKGAPSGKLLLDAGDVGHHGSLSPSDIKTIKESRYVVWFGSKLENNLANILEEQNNVISLYDLNAFNRKPLRNVKGEDIAGTLDPHIWLDPENAKAIARALGVLYSRARPQNKALYEQNVTNFSQRMDQAVKQVQESNPLDLDTVQPYWAYHDALQYIESTLNISLSGTLTTDHHLPPKASQFRWLQENRPFSTMCLVLQSENNSRVISKLAPLVTTIQQEGMGNNDDFITSWLQIAEELTKCVNQQK